MCSRLDENIINNAAKPQRRVKVECASSTESCETVFGCYAALRRLLSLRRRRRRHCWLWPHVCNCSFVIRVWRRSFLKTLLQDRIRYFGSRNGVKVKLECLQQPLVIKQKLIIVLVPIFYLTSLSRHINYVYMQKVTLYRITKLSDRKNMQI